ncbi:MAG: SusC/RagA family TonB-linked outer membrane protein, partial [Muribaculaceae bacterium]|nr:SusC/RagA family TonB-linked outer membrane protein [Muribaculaceae bacterium]
MKQVNIRIPQRILALMMGLFLSIGAYAQITVQGHVKDATGEPVIGATVTVVGTTNTVVTDFDGNFTITAPKGAQLQVSSIGLQSQTVTAAPTLEIQLLDDSQVLENVVVIGYGTVKKSDLTGSVTALRPDAKNKGVVVSAQDMLSGKVAGVSVTSGDGAPGGSATIRIRGGSSLNASNNPLIVIDGIAMDNNSISGVSNPLSLVNPQDIESFNVLKDASATAIYGSRGSNGVIIITTKKGRRNQAPQVSYNGSVTFSKKKKTIDVMNGDEYRTFVSDIFEGNTRRANVMGYAWRNAKNAAGDIEMLRALNTVQNGKMVYAGVGDIVLPEGYTWAEGENNQGIVKSLLGDANTNWQNEIYRTAISHDHNVTVTGSVKDFLPYRLSVGFTDQQGILKTSDYKRYTVALNLNPSLLNDHLTLNLNGKLAWTKSRFADTGAVGNAVRMDPTQPIYSSDPMYAGVGGYFDWMQVNNNDPAWPYTKNTNAPYNPVAMLDNHDNQGKTRSFIGSADIDYKIHGFEDLRLHLTLGGDFTHGEGHNISANISNTSNYYGNNSYYTQSKENLQLSTYAQYYKDFNDKHHFDIMAGYEWQHNWRKEYNESWGTYPTNSALVYGPTDITVFLPGTWIPAGDYSYGEAKAGNVRGEGIYRQNNGLGYRTENFLVSFFGRMNYIYDSRYYLTFTMRYDGSSRFRDHWAAFPSAALAWNIAEEAFMKDTPFSTLKLRLGWGKTGQQEGIGDYNYFANYVMSNGGQGSWYDVSGDGSKARPNVYNPELKWETTTTTNVGLDWGFMNGRLTGSIDWYYRKTTDLLNWATFSAMTNFRNAFYKNIGSLRNTGIEFSVNWKAISTDDLLWTLDYNLTYNSNKITELISNDPTYFVSTGSIGINGNAQAHFVDHPSHSFYVYQQIYDTNGKPIEGQVVDRNGDGVISESDKYLYKSPWAPVTMGFASKLEWKNWDFGFSLRASIGNYMFNNVMQGYHNVSPAAVFEEVSGFYLNNRPVKSVAMGWQTYDTETVLSDYWVQNASFLKCDNITLGYSFNELFKS